MFTLEQVVPWGRSLDEYRRMFALREDDLRLRIAGCADGPASFNKRRKPVPMVTAIGISVVTPGLLGGWLLPYRSADGQDQVSTARGAGLAAKYLGDMGIERDPAVLFAESFETGSKEDIRRGGERCISVGKSCSGFFMSVNNMMPPITPVENALYYSEVLDELSPR